MIEHREHRIHPAIGIVKRQVPYAFVATPGGLAEIESEVKTMIIRHLVVVWACVVYFASYDLGRHCRSVSSMIVPREIHVEALAETVRGMERELVPVVIACRIPVMPYAFDQTLGP